MGEFWISQSCMSGLNRFLCYISKEKVTQVGKLMGMDCQLRCHPVVNYTITISYSLFQNLTKQRYFHSLFQKVCMHNPLLSSNMSVDTRYSTGNELHWLSCDHLNVFFFFCISWSVGVMRKVKAKTL